MSAGSPTPSRSGGRGSGANARNRLFDQLADRVHTAAWKTGIGRAGRPGHLPVPVRDRDERPAEEPGPGGTTSRSPAYRLLLEGLAHLIR